MEKDVDRLLTFFDFPAEHWIHLRTSNPIESTFAAAKTRTRQTKGAGSRKAALAMAFKLAEAAEERWRKINAPQLAAAVLAGIRYKNGERILPDHHDATFTADSTVRQASEIGVKHAEWLKERTSLAIRQQYPPNSSPWALRIC